jgi:hypothetical protein
MYVLPSFLTTCFGHSLVVFVTPVMCNTYILYLLFLFSKSRVERNHNNWPQQYKQERYIHNLDKWTTPQERKSLKNKNNFKDKTF